MNELETFFAKMWNYVVDPCDVEGGDLQEIIAACGLGAWREVTQADIDAGAEFEVGDPILVLTDAGRAAIMASRKGGA